MEFWKREREEIVVRGEEERRRALDSIDQDVKHLVGIIEKGLTILSDSPIPSRD